MKVLPTSVVGSLPRPAWVRDLISNRTPLSDERAAAAMDAAVRYAVALQEQAGLDVISDGEWRRKSYIGVIADLAEGFELSNHPQDGRPMTTVVGRLQARNSGFIAREIEFLRSITSQAVKATLPAPALLGERLWDPASSSSAYPNREDFVRDCIPILREEVLRIRDAGADVVQVDDPHLCLFVDAQIRESHPDPEAAADFGVETVNALLEGVKGVKLAVRIRDAGADVVQVDDPHLCLFVDAQIRESHPDPEAAADFGVETVNALLEGVKGVKLAVHLCRRAGARARGESSLEGGYDPILAQLNRLKVDHLTLEFSGGAAGGMGVLGKLRQELEIGLGCVDVTPGKIDSVETIMARVERALEYLPPERITLNPDCGFAPGSGAEVSLDEAYAKLCNQTEAARLLRAKLGATG